MKFKQQSAPGATYPAFLRCLRALAVALPCSVLTALPAMAADSGSSVIEGSDGWLFPGWERSDQSDRNGLAANIKLLQEARDLLAARKIGLLVMVVPAKAAFYRQRLPQQVQLAPEVLSRYSDVLDLLNKAGINSFDDRAVLQTVEQGKQTAFYRADYHWTAWAAEASAEVAAQRISSSWSLPAGGTGTVLGEWTNDRRYGDLASNFMSPAERKRIGRDTYTVRKTAEAGDVLLDTGPAPVQVVGNSFVQPYLGFPQKLSNALSQPVGLTWNPGNVGPWKTMLDAVERPDFARSKPLVVVWQFNEAQLESGPDASANWDAAGRMSAAAWRSRMATALAK